MSLNLTAIEKGLYVYYKMCELFSYDINYHYKKMKMEFNRERLESITLDTSIVCWNFARIYSKLLELVGEGDIYGVVLDHDENDLGDHLGVGFVSVQGIVEFEPMSINLNRDKLSDLTNAKLKFPLTNIYPILFDSKTFSNYIQKMNHHFRFNNSSQNYLSSLGNNIAMSNKNIFKNIEDFLLDMKCKKIRGQELIYVFGYLNRNHYFGDYLEHEYLGRLKNREDKKGFIDNIRIIFGDYNILIDSEEYSYKVFSKEEIDKMYIEHQLGKAIHHGSIKNCIGRRK